MGLFGRCLAHISGLVDASSIPAIGFELESVKCADVRFSYWVGLSHDLAFTLWYSLA
jgi:hypothetical protein